MWPSREVGIHERFCDFSTDLRDRASFESFVVVPHLRDNIKFSAILKLVGNGVCEEELTLRSVDVVRYSSHEF